MDSLNIEPLSHSSSNEILGCEQKYVYRKVQKVEKDNDSPIDTLALDIGKALHACLEEKKHDLRGYNIKCLREKMEQEGVPAEHTPMLWAMLTKYKDLHESTYLSCEFVELEIKNEDFIGYIDAILKDRDGKWWITDVKTASSLNKALPKLLPRDKQLNLYYAFFTPEEHSLTWEDFGGCRYRVVTKSRLKKKEHEEDIAFSGRIYQNIQAAEYVIPKELMDPEGFKQEFFKMRRIQERLWKEDIRAIRNYGNCMSYFRPCEYWSRCHNGEHTKRPEVREFIL